MRSALALLLMLLVLGPGVALAHRGWSGYDSSKVLTLTGTIRAAGYEHSHGFVKLETPGKMWRVVVLAPFSRAENRGLFAADRLGRLRRSSVQPCLSDLP
ncbi:MAG TPA: hypothetical protein VGF25_13220 [Thermoleophilaceae bacterium]